MNSDQKRMFLAIGLSGLVLFIWQLYFAPAHFEAPPQVAPVATEATAENAQSAVAKAVVVDPNAAVDSAPIEPGDAPVEESVVNLSNEDHTFALSNFLALKNITNTAAKFDFQSISGSEKPFRIEILTTKGAQQLKFDVVERTALGFVGKNSEYDITFRANLAENGKLDFHLNSPNSFKYRFVFESVESESSRTQAGREFVFYSNDVTRESVGEALNGDGNLKWFGLDYNYHLFAFVLSEKSKISYSMSEQGQFVIDMLEGVQDFHGDLVFTKKNYDLLVELGDNLHLSVDFGLFGIIAVPILRGLEFFYDFIPNYGIAIILLTLLIRLITFPLQYKSFKSMKKMQILQPELQKVREKYKEDPQRLQKETMELFKRSGANPLGGCLPLIAQMPIFFAFYQVLYNAVEFVGAPFAFWIVDLSIKDPYYVLPVLMGGSLFLQMKINPTPTTDPMQKKIMMFMPLIFLFIMKDLPAGLNLYIFVSTIFGIVQQLLVYKSME